MSFKETKAFVRAALKNPRQVSTVFKSSKYLAQALVNAVDLENSQRILEIGCGTGAITKVIQKNIVAIQKQNPQKSYDYLGVEISQSLVMFLKETFPDLSFHCGSAGELQSILEDNSVDSVISSLPWTLFSRDIREQILNEVLRVLKPGGTFTTFICTNTFLTPNPYVLKKFFHNKLVNFQKTEMVFQNIPPSIVYKGNKPSKI
ncbi:MAG: methyltransferase domain-containing protein [Bdellovibrionaceae bacterium]|nr:methyltransferase domain-containing protein [Pseudobdellovibrionaceae bacterium]